jgi:Ni/Fe-hydrogenase subunit HybB-like protein
MYIDTRPPAPPPPPSPATPESLYEPAPNGQPVLAGRHTYSELTDRVTDIPFSRFTWRWLAGLGLGLSLTGLLLVSIVEVIVRGVGIWGINIPVGWGFAITNFVWWIGIGHAGTLISAILLLMRQGWRTSINRFAEAMTIFAVANAGLFPLLHLGRIWRFYYLVPYPNTMGLWPQWRSPLVWDVFAVTTYFTVSLLFWYLGLVPDLATVRDTARRRWVQVVAGIFSLGWRGSARHWQRYQALYLLLAGLATPLVVSVHSIVSMDFATGIVPGWHSTIFPPFFVAGAIYSGFAMVLTLAIPLRRFFALSDIVTDFHLDVMARVMLTTGLIVGYGYLMEIFTAWYSGEPGELTRLHNRFAAPYAPVFWATVVCNIIVPQALWFRRVRRAAVALFVISQFINAGMWLERFDIIVGSLYRDFMPSAWGRFVPTFWDWSTFVGTIGFFVTLFLLFVRFLPMISGFELRELLHVRGQFAVSHVHPVPSRWPVHEGATSSRIQAADDELHSLTAEFDTPEALIDAARRARERGYTRLDAFTPFPVEELPRALGYGRTPMSAIVLTGAVLGAASAYFMQWFSAVIHYPWNVGGRPLHSWPSFIPLTFELAVLGGATFGFFGLWALNRLPLPYHPIFNTTNFHRASRDRFFLAVERTDPRFNGPEIRRFLESLAPLAVHDTRRDPE